MNPSQHFGIGLHAPLFHATFELVLEVRLVKHENQRTLIDHAIAIPCHIFLLPLVTFIGIDMHRGGFRWKFRAPLFGLEHDLVCTFAAKPLVQRPYHVCPFQIDPTSITVCHCLILRCLIRRINTVRCPKEQLQRFFCFHLFPVGIKRLDIIPQFAPGFNLERLYHSKRRARFPHFRVRDIALLLAYWQAVNRK